MCSCSGETFFAANLVALDEATYQSVMQPLTLLTLPIGLEDKLLSALQQLNSMDNNYVNKHPCGVSLTFHRRITMPPLNGKASTVQVSHGNTRRMQEAEPGPRVSLRETEDPGHTVSLTNPARAKVS